MLLRLVRCLSLVAVVLVALAERADPAEPRLEPSLRSVLEREFHRYDENGDGNLSLEDFLSFASNIKGLKTLSSQPTPDRCGQYMHKVCKNIDKLPSRDVKRKLLFQMCQGCGVNVWSPIRGGLLNDVNDHDKSQNAVMATQAANFRSKKSGTGWKLLPDGRKRYLTGAEYLKSLISDSFR